MKQRIRKEAPPGMVTPKVLRSLIKAVMRKLQDDPNITAKETIDLLREQKRLASQLQKSTDAQERLARDARVAEAVRRSGAYGGGTNGGTDDMMPNTGNQENS